MTHRTTASRKPRIVVALGGNALLRRGEPMTAEVQRANVANAAAALAPLAADHELVITHGNGPQVGLLALQAGAGEVYPMDVLGAETEGMIGYLIEQELGNRLPADHPIATLLTMVEVDPRDPAFERPAKFVGPLYDKAEADRLAVERNWVFRQDGKRWRRVVPSPAPRRIFELRPIKWLLERGTVVVCAGGGGIPTTFLPGEPRRLCGVEAVIDKDLCSALLARELEADLLVLLTDVDAVYLDWRTPRQRAIRRAAPAALVAGEFTAGSMGPKVEAACRFATDTGKPALIGALTRLGDIIAGRSGTRVEPACGEMVLADGPLDSKSETG